MNALFRKGDPTARGQPARTALIRKNGGWFGGAGRAPDVPMDADVLTEVDLAAYTAALKESTLAKITASVVAAKGMAQKAPASVS